MKDFFTSWLMRRWRWIVATIVLALLCFYITSYLHLSRRGMREAKAMNMKGFLYIPVEQATGEKEMLLHYERAKLYAPANRVDQALTGAEGPVQCILFGPAK